MNECAVDLSHTYLTTIIKYIQFYDNYPIVQLF